MQVAIITDTNSGIRQGEEEKGLFIVAMPFTISGKDYLDGENLSQKEFYVFQEQGEDISTSQPSPAYLTELWDRVLKTYDAIVHIPMSSALSSSCATAKMLASDEPYEGRVFVVDNKRISVSLRAAVKEALTLRDQGQSPEEIKAYLEETEGNSTIYVTVDTLKYFKEGWKDYAGRRPDRYSFADKAGPFSAKRQAGRLEQGKDHEAGKANHALGHQGGYQGAFSG